MTTFTQDKLKAIKAVAYQFKFTVIADKPGIFMDENKIIINTLVRTGATGYTGLPMIGKYDGKGNTDENDSSPIIEQVREAIAASFKALPKTKPKVEHDSTTAKQEYKGAVPNAIPEAPKKEKKDEPKTEAKVPGKQEALTELHEKVTEVLTKTGISLHKFEDELNKQCLKTPEPEQKKSVKIISCCVCGFELPHAEALKQSEDGIRPAEMKCADCAEKKTEPKEKNMNESKEVIPAKPGINMPANQQTGIKPLTIQDIRTYLCPKATESEAYMFFQLCVNRGLNPFLKEAYLVKYGDSAATMIVGKDAFTRKAEESGMLDGYEAGIIVKTAADPTTIEERVGTILYEKEVLLGGWARIYRKDMSKPFEVKVGLNEYKKQNNWLTMPGTMIRKVALVQALREAFTKELGGCYDAAEVGDGL